MWTPRHALAAAALLAAAIIPLPATAAAPTALPPIDPAASLRIMPLGDSITVGTGATYSAGYRWTLGAYMLNTGGYPAATYVGSQADQRTTAVRHEGHNGVRIDQLAGAVDGWINAARPDIVLLHVGANDARSGATGDVMLARMSTLIDRILGASPTVRLIVSDLIPLHGPGNDPASPAVQRFNRGIGALVAAKGPRVSLARMSVIPSGVLADGLHPNDGGYTQMAWVWWRCMAPILSADGVTGYGRDPMAVNLGDKVLCQTPA